MIIEAVVTAFLLVYLGASLFRLTFPNFFDPLEIIQFAEVLNICVCFSDGFIAAVKSHSAETFLLVWKLEIVTEGRIGRIWWMRKWFVDQLINYCYSGFSRGHPWIVMAKCGPLFFQSSMNWSNILSWKWSIWITPRASQQTLAMHLLTDRSFGFLPEKPTVSTAA